MACSSRWICASPRTDEIFGMPHVSPPVDESLTLFDKCAENPQLLRLLPHIPLMWRLTAAENTILSGFQLELYSARERTFAYWYLSQVIETHLGCIEDVLAVLPSGISPVEWRIQLADRPRRRRRIPRNEIPSYFSYRLAGVGNRNDNGTFDLFR